MMKKLRKCLGNENGATAIEYGLIAALIAVVITAGVTSLGKNVGARFNTVATSVGK